MKTKYIIIIGVMVCLIIGGGIYLVKKLKEKEIIKKIEIGELTSLYFSYSNGYMMNANIWYEFKYDDNSDRYMVMIKPYLIEDENRLEVEVDESFKDKLKEILVKYEVFKWEGFSKSDHNVLDGDSFSFNAWFKDKTSIHASGYMMWPENYRNVRDELDKLFMEIYNKEKGIENE